VPEQGVVLNINKPIGWTSFDVVQLVRKTLGVRRVGHSGTLDPFAEGVLLVCVGAATKRVPELMALPKVYTGTMELGLETDTLDVNGRVVRRARPRTRFRRAELVQAMGQLVGEIKQVPPMYSAVKVGGKRLYELARAHQEVAREARTVEVYRFAPVRIEHPFVKFVVECGKGTYVRSLVAEVGRYLGCGATLKTLQRAAIGPFRIEQAIGVDEIRNLHFRPSG
jgi:tRNA pseudouridine55 synthase